MSESITSTLDLRQIAPSARHLLIFNRFADLMPGQKLELLNDHDPQPLNDQFQLRAPGLFSWHSMENGPHVWRVQIGKKTTVASASSANCCSAGNCCG